MTSQTQTTQPLWSHPTPRADPAGSVDLAPDPRSRRRATAISRPSTPITATSVTPAQPAGLSRRRFLTGGAAVSLVAVLGNLAGGSAHLLTALASQEPRAVLPIPTPVQRFSVERPVDLIQLDITFTGFRATVIDNELRDLTPGPGSFITVQFPPQAIAEAAYSYDSDPWPVDPPPVLSVMSGPSRLVFLTHAPVAFSHPMTVADLLDWSQWTLLVPDLRAGAPLADRTCIEYPYALYLSPESISTTAVQPGSPTLQPYATFAGRAQPLVSPAQVSDCWTAAYVPTSAGAAIGRSQTMAALGARDLSNGVNSPALATVTPESATITYRTPAKRVP